MLRVNENFEIFKRRCYGYRQDARRKPMWQGCQYLQYSQGGWWYNHECSPSNCPRIVKEAVEPAPQPTTAVKSKG